MNVFVLETVIFSGIFRIPKNLRASYVEGIKGRLSYDLTLVLIKGTKSTLSVTNLVYYIQRHLHGRIGNTLINAPKVLIVDDSATSCLLMARALQKAGYQVTVANDGYAGLTKALQERPHCVIVDVVLPGVSGFGLCRQLRSLDPQRNLSIIMVSTKNTPLDHSWGIRQGADHYLPKPFTEETLVRVVGDVLISHMSH